MRYFIGFICFLMSVACSAPKSVPYIKHVPANIDTREVNNLYLKITADENKAVKYHGLASYDDVNAEHGGIAYPAATAEMFFGALIAHMLTTESIKNSEKTERQDEADKVLGPYTEMLKGFSNGVLLDDAFTLLANNDPRKIENIKLLGSNSAWVIESTPVFFMTQDRKSLILDNAISIYDSSVPDDVVYSNLVEITSLPFMGEPTQYWQTGEKVRLLEISTKLYSRSITIALNDFYSNNKNLSNHEETFKFYQDGKKKYERGSLLEKDCERIVMRTLRGWLKSVPVWVEEDGAAVECNA